VSDFSWAIAKAFNVIRSTEAKIVGSPRVSDSSARHCSSDADAVDSEKCWTEDRSPTTSFPSAAKDRPGKVRNTVLHHVRKRGRVLPSIVEKQVISPASIASGVNLYKPRPALPTSYESFWIEPRRSVRLRLVSLSECHLIARKVGQDAR